MSSFGLPLALHKNLRLPVLYLNGRVGKEKLMQGLWKKKYMHSRENRVKLQCSVLPAPSKDFPVKLYNLSTRPSSWESGLSWKDAYKQP